MSRFVTIRVNLDELPAAIAESLATTLKPHRATFAQLDVDGLLEGVIPPADRAALLRELGNNLAQTVLGVGQEVEHHRDCEGLCNTAFLQSCEGA